MEIWKFIEFIFLFDLSTFDISTSAGYEFFQFRDKKSSKANGRRKKHKWQLSAQWKDSVALIRFPSCIHHTYDDDDVNNIEYWSCKRIWRIHNHTTRRWKANYWIESASNARMPVREETELCNQILEKISRISTLSVAVFIELDISIGRQCVFHTCWL